MESQGCSKVSTAPPGTAVPAVTSDLRVMVTHWASYYSSWTESEMEQEPYTKLADDILQ